MEYEHIVVGAGAAGCAFATRLSQLTDGPILLLEAGGPVRDPRSHIPLAFMQALQSPGLTWTYPTTTPSGAASEAWVRGRGLGGSTVVNGHLHLRPTTADLRAVAAAVDDPWWSAHGQQAGLRAIEAPNGSAWTPGDGVPVRRPAVGGPVVDAVRAAAASDGVDTPIVASAAAALHDREHLDVVPVTIHRGRRTTAGSWFLPAAGAGLEIRTGVEVERLLFDGDRVVGVRTVAASRRARGDPSEHRATGAVVLCAGALATPLLLQRSGIGPEATLRGAGVSVRVASERVGQGLVEPRAVTVTLRLRDGLGRTPALATRLRRADALARYAVTRDGPLAAAPFELAGSLSIADRPLDAHVLVGTLCPDAEGRGAAAHPGAIVQGYPAQPTSAASVTITGAGLGAPPRVEVAHVASASDRAITIGLLHRIRRWVDTPPLRALVVAEISPGRGVATDEEIVAHVRRRGAGIYHGVGSCAAGPEETSVVDAQLRVRGIEGLRVVDASVFPLTPGPGTAAATAALAWRSAEVLARTCGTRPPTTGT